MADIIAVIKILIELFKIVALPFIAIAVILTALFVVEEKQNEMYREESI